MGLTNIWELSCVLIYYEMMKVTLRILKNNCALFKSNMVWSNMHLSANKMQVWHSGRYYSNCDFGVVHQCLSCHMIFVNVLQVKHLPYGLKAKILCFGKYFGFYTMQCSLRSGACKINFSYILGQQTRQTEGNVANIPPSLQFNGSALLGINGSFIIIPTNMVKPSISTVTTNVTQ